MKIKLLQIREATDVKICDPKSVVDSMQEEALADRECLWCLHLNTTNNIIEKELVSMGILNASLVTPREVFKKAIINSACSIILVHNHPSGDPTPSSIDIAVTRQLVKCGEILEIKVIDHIILGSQGRFVSLKGLKMGG